MITSKWPLLLVVGEPVTHEQADEILVRTAGWHYFATNDRAFSAAIDDLAAEFGRPPEPAWPTRAEEREPAMAARSAWYPSIDAWCKSFGILELSYLQNDQIVSSWIGGPHGWCDWSGRIGCSSYNVGKWPSTDEVTADWETVAAAFPYLDLTAQLVEDEGEGQLAGQWRVKDGAVTYTDDPSQRVAEQRDISADVMVRMVAPWGERGVSLDRLRSALTRVARLREGRHADT